jgi:hypothetical protein
MKTKNKIIFLIPKIIKIMWFKHKKTRIKINYNLRNNKKKTNNRNLKIKSSNYWIKYKNKWMK